MGPKYRRLLCLTIKVRSAKRIKAASRPTRITEVSHLAEKPAEAKKPIDDRDKIYAAAEALKLGWIA